MILKNTTFWLSLIGVLFAFSFVTEAVSVPKKKLYGESQYESCLLESDAQHASTANGDTYCCSKSQGQCVRCPKDGNLPCSITSYSKRPQFLNMSKPTHKQRPQPKAAPVAPTSPPKRPALKTAPTTKLTQ